MQIIIREYDSFILDRVVYVSHKESRLTFRVKKIIRDRIYETDNKLFYHINWYWSMQPEEVQDKIFDIYAEIRTILNRDIDTTFGNAELTGAIARLIDLHPIDRLHRWITTPGVVPWPKASEVSGNHSEASAAKHTRDKTFTLEDYQDMMAFVLQLRIMTPIWGDFLQHYEAAISRNFKEMIALQLTSDSKMSDGPGYQKLETYINAMTANKAGKTTSGVLELIGSGQYSNWLFSHLVIKRLASSAIYPPEGETGPYLVKHISNHIKDRTDKSEAEFGTPEKKKPDDNRNEEAQHSNYESYRVKQTLPGGDRYFLQWYMQDLPRLARELEPQLPKGLLQDFLSLYGFGDFIPAEPQILMLQWVMAPVISPRAVPDLSRISVSQALAVAGAVLWHRGHQMLSAFITSRHSDASMEANLTGESVSRMSNQVYEVLPRIFPFNRKRPTTEKGYKNITDTAKTLAQEFGRNVWHPTLPDKYLNEISDYITGTEQNRNLIVPASMRPLIMNMIIDLADRPLEETGLEAADKIARKMGLDFSPLGSVNSM